ncbi:MAG: protein translocase subunit SecD [Verrucomicrobiota bacterium]|jgi:SecD/SecF fusion protein
MNKNNNLGRFILVLIIIAWALMEIYPPTSRDLVKQFAGRAQKQDAAFSNILATAISLQKAGTNNEFTALQLATGTNDLQKYFPFYPNAANQLLPNTYILNRLQRDASGKIKLGIDLQGGTSFLVEMNTNALSATNNAGQARSDVVSAALSQAIEVLRKRIDRFGVAEPIIQSAGGNRILIQLPGLSESDKQSAEEQIKKKAYLEFRMVADNSDDILKSGDPIPPGYELLKHVEQQPNNQSKVEECVVKKTPENGLFGDIVKDAGVGRDNMGNPRITFELTADGAKRFAETTEKNVGHRLAIVLDGELQSAPNIQSPILGGEGEITGNYTAESAYQLANVLQNPMRAPLVVVQTSDVGATLGRDAISSGIKASIYGVAFVSLFMFGYYLLAGLAANVALVTNIIILLGVMCSIGTTFTLPGIAGGVLTVGMAVDANVLIYERIREELAKGKSLRGAIEAGYARAFGTIFDSHVTTLISSIILIMMGTGEIKGFGVTLTIGVAASLFTALVVTRLIFNFLVDRNWIKSLHMAHIIKSSHLDFMKIAGPLALATSIFAVAAIGFGCTRGTHQLFGIDFLGGDSTQFTYAQRIPEGEVRAALAPLGEKDATIQYQKGANLERLSVTTSGGSAARVETALKEKFPQARLAAVAHQQVGATLGREILQSAVIASLLAMFGILVYVAVRYEFFFAVAAVIAVLHDVLFAIGAYCIANAISGRQFNATVVAAILTIIGFSINDKIVIFDRIRENLRLGVRGSFKEVINQALNQTLSRTIITSGTVLIATGCLYWFGGGVINDFAFTFLVGIVVGTYSSIYIASTIVLKLHKGQRPNIGGSGVAVQGAQAAVKVS